MSTQSSARPELRIYRPDTRLDAPERASEPALSVPPSAVETVTLSERIQGTIDSATFSFTSVRGEFAGTINLGDRIELWLKRASGRPYNTGAYGRGPYSGSATRHWTGIVRGLSYDREGPGKTEVELDAEDYVSGIMGMRLAYDAFENKPIAGSPDAILDTILDENCPEIDRAMIDTIDLRTDVFIDGREVGDIVVDLARRADAVFYGNGTSLVFTPAEEYDAAFIVENRDYHTHSVRVTDDHLVNDLRVDGGTEYAVDQEQLDVERYERVTDTDRILVPIQARKSSYDRVEVWTRKDPESDDSVVVRLQNDRNDQPVAVGDTESDIAQQQLPHYFISNDDFTTFLIPQHVLPPGEQIWIIIEGGGETGHNIGINLDGVPAFRAHFPYPLDVRVENMQSQRRYRRREDRIKRDNLSSFRASRDFGEAILRSRGKPRKELAISPRSERFRSAAVGEVVTVEFPDETAVGDYILCERTDAWSGPAHEITFVAREVSSL